MKKSRFIVFSAILITVALLGYNIYDGFNDGPSRISLNYRYVEDAKIHEDLDGLQIAFISDFHYLEFLDDKRLDTIIEKIQSVNPDVVIFLGDLIAEEMNDKQYAYMLKSLDSITATYGKFAVLGEADYKTEKINEDVEKILYDADFEILKNQMIPISKGTKRTIELVGIDSPLDGKDDIEKAYNNVSDENFTLTIMHTPDTAKNLPHKSTQLAVAGHSHGGQVNIPLLGQVYNKELAEEYYSGLYAISNMKLYVTNGLGTTEKDVRINAPAEIVIYTLKSK